MERVPMRRPEPGSGKHLWNLIPIVILLLAQAGVIGAAGAWVLAGKPDLGRLTAGTVAQGAAIATQPLMLPVVDVPAASIPAAGPLAGAAPAATTTPAASALNQQGPVRLQIDRIGVNAPVVVRGIDSHNVMEAPDRGSDVAWYDFTAVPGQPGNVVLAGHLDWYDIGPAVFWNLRRLQTGDTVKVVAGSGQTYVYRVVSSSAYRADSAPVGDIIGPTRTESVTLITCAGTYSRTARQYDERLVVRAERVPAG